MIYDVNDEDLSMCFGVDAIPDLDIKISSGKGGAFFLKNIKHSTLLIKSITPGEYEIFKQFAAKYYTYVLSNPNTLLTPIFGIFSLALTEDNSIPDIHFIVMKTVFDPNLVSERQKMMLFDLKGSTHGRSTLKLDEYNIVKNIRTCPKSLLKETMKDLDFSKVIDSLNLKKSKKLKLQLLNDAEFLSHHNFMDYSLLLFMVYDYGKHTKGLECESDDYDNCDVAPSGEDSSNIAHPKPIDPKKKQLSGKYLVKLNFIDKIKEESKKDIDVDSNLPIANNIDSFSMRCIDENGYEYSLHIYIGIIDYLTDFGLSKKLEQRFKKAYSQNISCVPPDQYSARFIKFIQYCLCGNSSNLENS